MTFSRRALLVAAAALVPSTAVACLWDYDTLLQERSRFPGTLELITGKFLRHSPEFYEWRVRDREARLASDPNNLALLDDLAVAYHKTGRNDKAIETAHAADRLQPNRYETIANLSTFLVLSGRWEEGLAQVNRALAINPDAHFGREKYQKALVEYVLKQRPDGKVTLPLMDLPAPDAPLGSYVTVGGQFSQFLDPTSEYLKPAVRQAALKGVQGMLRFANHDNPLLLEALGSLLSSNYIDTDDAKQLAARAYLKASDEVTDETAKAAYRRAADHVLAMQSVNGNTSSPTKLDTVEAEFRRELADARAWYDELRQREIGWIRDGLNPDEEFAKLYLDEPEVYPPAPGPESYLTHPYAKVLVRVGAGTAVLAAVLVLLWFRRRQRQVLRPAPVAGSDAPANPV